MRYLIDQKDSIVLEKVRNIFNIGKVSARSGTKGVFRYIITGFVNINIVISYFELFPLYTKKKYSLTK
jgi:hypothetical protein